VAQAALDEGLQVLGFLPQARLLTNLGLLDDLADRHRAAGTADPLAWAREAQAAQVLLSPAEMGELFKAIGLSRGIDSVGPGFARGDRPLALEAA
jgi:SAM-dependent MidA family methyltransferase